MKWLDKKVADVFRRWRNNDVSLVAAARELAALGYGPEAAWDALQRY